MKRLVDNLLKANYDLVVVDGLQMAQYVQGYQGLTIIQEQNLEYEIMQRHYQQQKNPLLRLIYYWDYQKLIKYEIKVLSDFRNVFFFTERDNSEAHKLVANLRGYCIPLAIDTEKFQPGLNQTFQKKVCTNGSLNLYPNLHGLIWFSNEVVPQILKTDPEVEFYHIGAYGEACKELLHPAIKLVGYVPDITEQMHSGIIHAVPIKIGGGIRVKILNSMASGIPIVTTPMAAQGIAVEDHKDMFITDDSQNFAQAVLKLLNSPQIRNQFIKNCRAIINCYYSKDVVHQKIANVVGEIQKNPNELR
jgi:glycosyltransferase involved in cell wall biosynthesis